MKILAYEVRPDEQGEMLACAQRLGIELVQTKQVPTPDNAGLTAGCDGVTILGQGCIDAAFWSNGTATACAFFPCGRLATITLT